MYEDNNDGVQEPDSIEIAANDMINRASVEIGGVMELTFLSWLNQHKG